MVTMDGYSRSYTDERSEAVAALPDLSQTIAQEARATGTDDGAHLAEYLASQHGRRANAVDSGGPKTVESTPQSTRRGARVVEGTGLENRRGRKVTGGSNPPLSASTKLATCRDGL